jgi:hypothetical protein
VGICPEVVVTKEEMGEIIRDGGDLDGDGDRQWTEDDIQQAQDSCLPAREALFGEVAINIASEVGVFSHDTYCSVARPGQLTQITTMADMLQYQQ